MKPHIKTILIAGIIALAAFFIFPWRTIVIAPSLRVLVLDVEGKPARDAIVKQEWDCGAVGTKQQEELGRTDSQGYAVFPRRVDKISLLQQCLSILREVVSFPHGYSIGPHTTVWAYGEEPYIWSYESRKPHDAILEVIRLKRFSTTVYP